MLGNKIFWNHGFASRLSLEAAISVSHSRGAKTISDAPEGQNNLAQRFGAGCPQQFEQGPEVRHDKCVLAGGKPMLWKSCQYVETTRMGLTSYKQWKYSSTLHVPFTPLKMLCWIHRINSKARPLGCAFSFYATLFGGKQWESKPTS